MKASKVCTRCKEDRLRSEFRERISRKKGKDYHYPNATCKKCDAEIASKYHEKHKDDEGYKEKARKRVGEHRVLNYDKIMAKRKITHRACNKSHSDYRKKYWRENEEQRARHGKRAWKNHEKNRDELSDRYVAGVIVSKSTLRVADVINEKELIEFKRTQIMLIRGINNKLKKS